MPVISGIGPQAGASSIVGSSSLPASPTFRQIYVTPAGCFVCLSDGSWTLLEAGGIGNVTGTGTTNLLTKWTNGAGSVIGDSLISDNGTTLAYNTNKFTVAAASGNTLIAGTTTISSLTSGRVPYAGTAGLLSDDSGFTYNSGTHALTATTFAGALTGNSSTATALQNARTIGGVSFDGTANITVTTATGGFTVSGGDLALGANNITMTGSLGSTGSRLTKGWFTDLQVTNSIAGSITGNAATVTTNANLTGDVTSVGNASTLANIPTATPAVGTILHTNIAAPSSPAAGKVSVYSDSTDLRFHDKNASGTIGTTVVADTGATNNFLTAISAAGVISKAQPAFSNISGTATSAQLPVALANQTSINGLGITASTGTLTVTNAKTLSISNTLTLAGTDSSTLNIGAGGTLGSAAFKATGTSGNTVPLLDGANTWSTTQTFAHITSTSGVIGGTTSGLDINFQNTGATIPAGISIGWTASGSNQAAKDTRLFRVSAGLFGLGTSDDSTVNGSLTAANVKLGATTARGTTEGTNQVVIFNGTAPAGTLVNGATFFCAAGEMKVIDAGGTVTLLSSHSLESGKWIHDSYSSIQKKRLVVQIEDLCKFIDAKFGTNFVEEILDESPAM